MAKKGGLGKGLDAIFHDNARADDGGAVELNINELEPNRGQPRKEFSEEAMRELADSIAQHGVLQPLLVRPLLSGGYQIVAGERRWRASRMAGLATVPALIRELTDSEVMQIALIENLQREDLKPLEEAQGYQALMEEFGFTQDEISKSVGKSRPAVTNALRLLNLPEAVRGMLARGDLSAGHARTLLSFKDEAAMLAAAKRVVAEGLSVRWPRRRMRKSRRPSAPRGASATTTRRSSRCAIRSTASCTWAARRKKACCPSNSTAKMTSKICSMS